jgi:hypothetical protein
VERSQFGEDGESARSKYVIWVARIKTEFRRKHVQLQPKEAEEVDGRKKKKRDTSRGAGGGQRLELQGTGGSSNVRIFP